MYGPTWPFLLMYGFHDMRHIGFRRLTVVNGTPGDRGVTMFESDKIMLTKNDAFVGKGCHTPIPGPTRLEDPNRVQGTRLYTGTLYLIFFSQS